MQDAIPGSDEKGYSQALLGVDGEWPGMEVRALPQETEIIENEASAESAAKRQTSQLGRASTDD